MSTTASPLFLVHGFTGRAEVWSDVRREMSGEYAVHAVDLPGHGRNAHVTDERAVTFDGATLRIIDEATQIGAKRFNLWGYSMGGRIALHLALNYSNMVERLVLESASPGLADPFERKARLESDERLAGRILSEGLEGFVDYWTNIPLFASQKTLPAARQALGRQLRMRGTAEGYAAALRGFGVGSQIPLHNRLQELTMPVLVIAGELDQKYREIGEAMAGSIPGAQFRIIPGAGHAPHWERPIETAAAVAEFLGKA